MYKGRLRGTALLGITLLGRGLLFLLLGRIWQSERVDFFLVKIRWKEIGSDE